MSYRQPDKYYESLRNHNYNSNSSRNLNRDFLRYPPPPPPRENSYYYDPRRYVDSYHRVNYPENQPPRLNYFMNTNQRHSTRSSNEIRININNNHDNYHYNNQLNERKQVSDSRKPIDRKMNLIRDELNEKNNQNDLEIVKSIDKSISAETNKQETEQINKRKNVLSIEEAVKLSTPISNQEKAIITTAQQPEEKKRKLDQNESQLSTEAESPNKNPHLKELESYDRESAKMKQLMSELLVDMKRLKNELLAKLDAYRELKIKRKTMKVKMRKICRAITKEDDNESDSSNLEAEAGSNDGTMDIGSVAAVADNSSSSSSSSSSHGSDVQVIAVDETGRRDKTSQSSSSSSDDDCDDSDSSCGSDVQVVNGPQQQPAAVTVSSGSSSDSNSEDKPVAGDNVIKSEQIQTEQPGLKEQHQQLKQSPSISNTARNSNPIAIGNSIPIEKAETKINTKNTIPECVDTSFMLGSSQTNLSNSFQIIVKPDVENGLFHAIEPKLNTIIISDEDKTFITDIKVFNNRLFVSASHGLLRQYHLGTHECITDYKGHQSLIHCLLPTVHPVGLKRILSGGFDKTLFVHNIDTGAILSKIEEESAILSICDLLDFVYYGTAKGNVATFSLEKNKRMSSFSASDKGISCVTATKDANVHLLFVGANTGEYSVWNAITYIKLKVITPVSHIEIPIDFIVLQKQRILAYTKNHVHFIQFVKSKSTSTFNHFDSISSLCLTRNYIIIGGVCGKVSVYRIKGSHIPKTPIRTIANSNSPVISLTFYNNTIITGDKTGKVYFNRLAES